MIGGGDQGAVLHDIVRVLLTDGYDHTVFTFHQLSGKILLLAQHGEETFRLVQIVILRNVENICQPFHVQVHIQHILQRPHEVGHHVFRQAAHGRNIGFKVFYNIMGQNLTDGLPFIAVCHGLG